MGILSPVLVAPAFLGLDDACLHRAACEADHARVPEMLMDDQEADGLAHLIAPRAVLQRLRARA